MYVQRTCQAKYAWIINLFFSAFKNIFKGATPASRKHNGIKHRAFISAISAVVL